MGRNFLPLAAAMASFASACTSPSTGPAREDPSESEAPRLGTTTQAIVVEEIIARADQWIAEMVPYCGGVRGGTDYVCGGTCNRPAAAWDAYRSDASGYVGWCWQVSPDTDSSGFMKDLTGADGWHSIALDDLRAGDALVAAGNVKLFSRYATPTSMTIYEQYNCGAVAHKIDQAFSRNGETAIFSGDPRPYHGIRRNGIVVRPTLAVMKGNVDALEGQIRGWAFDPAATVETVDVDIVIDGDSANKISTRANGYRPDVTEDFGVDPNHGFVVDTPQRYCDGKEHRVVVQAHSIVKRGTSTELTSTPKVLTCTVSGPPPPPDAQPSPPVAPVPSSDSSGCALGSPRGARGDAPSGVAFGLGLVGLASIARRRRQRQRHVT